MKTGEVVKRLRTKLGMSQVKLADKSGLPQTTISNIESLGTDPTGKTIKKLASALGVSTDELLGMEEVAK